jgi:cation transporter-like permease
VSRRHKAKLNQPQLATAAPRSTPKNATAFLESLSKALALGLVVTYLLGFIIVSLHNEAYGFTELNPFKVRILSAGALFVFLTLLPVIGARQTFRRLLDKNTNLKPEQKLSRGAVRSVVFATGAYFFANGLLPLYVLSPDILKLGPDTPLFLKVGAPLLLGALLFIPWGKHNYMRYPTLTAVLGFLFVLSLVAWIAWKAGGIYVTQKLALWFFLVGIISLFIQYMFGNHQWSGDPYGIAMHIVPLIGAIFVFANFVYPNIKPSWGGGGALHVVVFLSPESRIHPGEQIEADLLDESDSGVYLIQGNQKQAMFIPRSAIVGLQFADRFLTASDILQETIKKQDSH